MDTLRIFISSPGDVAEERDRARQVVQGLRRRYAQHFELVPVFWEDMPLTLDMSFQQGIDLVLSRDSGADVAVFILWSRLGSPLGPLVKRDDGREYRSGTERELALMLAARQAQGGGRPEILAYARQDEASFEEALRGKSTAEKEELLRQKRLVETFLREEFHDAETGANVRAYHTFTRPQSFAERLRVHLQEILDGLCVGRPVRPVWEFDVRGPPFRGLEAFGFEHAEIFFGREDEVAEARARLGEAARRGTAFLLIGGASGTGKSSLAAAGLVPEIVAHETDDSVGRWLHAAFTPAAVADDPAAGLSRILAAAVPTLGDRGDQADFAEALARDPALAVKLVLLPALKAAARPGEGAVRLVLLVDQFEELFSDRRFGERERATFAGILQALASSGSVWVVATLRGDWYPRLLECPALVALKTAGAQLDLVPPEIDAVRRMIESPAAMAGLAFEKIGTTSLADRILRDVAERAELLPLLEDLLRELFERRSPEGLLTVAAYESLGGIEGSLAKRAEASLAALPVDAQLALPEVFRRLVATGEGGDASPVRRRAPLDAFSPGSHARTLVERLVADRLATASAREDGMPEVAVAHEALLRVWPRAAAWIRENAEFLRVRDRLVARMREGAPLTAADPILPAAKAILHAQPDALEPDLAAYVEGQLAAIDADRRRRDRTRRAVVAGLATLAVAASVTAGSALWQWREATRARDAEAAQRAAAEDQRRLAVDREREARAITRFYEENVLAVARPKGWFGGAGKDVTLKAAITMAAPQVETAFPGQPVLEATVRNTLGQTFRYLGDYEAANSQLERALALRKTELGDDHPDTLASMHELAVQRWRQQRTPEAVQLARVALEGRTRVLGPEHEDTLFTQVFLGLFLAEIAEDAEAEVVLKSGVDTCVRVLGPLHHHTLHGQHDLAILYSRSGKPGEALALHEKTLDGRRQSLGPEHPDTLRSMDLVAQSLGDLGRFDAAEKLCREGLAMRTAVLGKAHTETLWSMWSLAWILQKKGDVEGAEQIRRQALGIAEAELGRDAPDTIEQLTYLGVFLLEQQSPAEAVPILRESVDRSTRAIGPENPDTLYRMRLLARALSDKGRYDESRELNQRVLQAQVRTLGENHPFTLRTRIDLAMISLEVGELTAAFEQLSRVLAARRSLSGDDHPYTLRDESNLAAALSCLARWGEADDLYRDVAQRKERQFGPEHDDVLKARGDLATIAVARGDLEAALGMYTELCETSRRALGDDAPRTIELQDALADVLRQMGARAEAEKLRRRSLEQRRRLYPEGHVSIRESELALAVVLGEQGKCEEANPLFATVIGAWRERFGDSSLKVAEALLQQGDMLVENGRADDAEEPVREALAIRAAMLPDVHWRVAATRSLLGHVRAQRGMLEEGETLQAAACDHLCTGNGAPREAVCRAFDRLAGLYARTNRPELAERTRERRDAAVAEVVQSAPEARPPAGPLPKREGEAMRTPAPPETRERPGSTGTG